MQHGSLINLIGGTNPNTVPVVGMGVTFFSWSDRSAGTIQAVKRVNGKYVLEVTDDKAIRTDGNGMSDSQSYDYIPNPDGHRIIIKQDSNGVWRVARRTPTGQMRVNQDCQKVGLGYRDAHYDYSF